jgi:hypothetical protein
VITVAGTLSASGYWRFEEDHQMDRHRVSGYRSSAVAILGAGAVLIGAVAVLFVLMTGTKDQTGQTTSQGATPTEQVKAPPVGTGSSSTTGTAPRNQEGR